MSSYKDLIVWQKGIELVLEIYKVTGLFPSREQFGLVSQMRRAAVSIVSNIAEGYGRNNLKENKQFVNISYGSSLELDTQVLVSKQLGYAAGTWNRVDLLIGEVQKMLYSYRNSLSSKL